MKRGGYGKPWRPPADGWSVPPKIFFGGLYQHVRPALNNLPRFQNNTQVMLQTNEVGPPVTRINPAALDSNCGVTDTVGLPEVPWIGVAANQALPSVLGGNLTNTFQQNGTNSFGQAARLRGFKNVQAVRQWHGAFGFLSQDDPDACDDTYCNPVTSDCGFSYTTYRSPQPVPDQLKYLRADWTVNYSYTATNDSEETITAVSSGSGHVSVDPFTSIITNALTTSEVDTDKTFTGPLVTTRNIVNGYDSVANAYGIESFVDGVIGSDLRCGTPAVSTPGQETATALSDFINVWNNGNCGNGASLFSAITDINNYGPETVSFTDSFGVTGTYTLEWHRTETTFSWNFVNDVTRSTDGTPPTWHIEFSGTCTLSVPNPASNVYTDVQTLLGLWNLADDAQYPWRTDGVWQIAPLVSRDEYPGPRTPLGFYPYYVNDPRSPGVANAVVPWFDAAAYGYNQAGVLTQYALTGLICGMPMPAAFTDSRSFWYVSGYTPPANADFENFFDFRADVWRACQYPVPDEGTFVDFYEYGYGQWLYDAIGQTGAQLPHCATQWTNLMQAFNRSPYAYLINGDKQTYDQDGQPGPAVDFHDFTGGLSAQKCCEIVELWPSQDFARPADNDRFAPDETATYCIASVSGQIIDCQTPPAGISLGDYVGINSNGFSGIYSVTDLNVIGNTVTISNDPVYPLPTGFNIPSNDSGTCLWRVRFKNAPAILGRDAIASLTASGGNTIITLASPEVNLMTGDLVDICSTTISYDAKGNRVSEAMTVLQSAIAVNRTDDTHFTVGIAIGALTGAAYIVSHGAANWYWDDNGRKGDFVALQWLFDYRTNGQAADNVNTCAGITPGTNNGFQLTPALPATCSANNSLSWTSDGFQAQGAIVFKPCCYGVVAITPNGESWPNGVVIPFPANFTFDERYGARWQCEVEQAMQDLLWQAPHTPCTFLGTNNTWNEDNGNCLCPGGCPNSNFGTDFYYAHAPLVEARITLPANGGNNQNETAPALPAGVTIGYINPASVMSGGLTPPGMIGYDPTTGNPSGAFTFWSFRLSIENNACFGSCQFNYVDLENLPCVVSYSPPAPAAPADGNSASGNSGDNTTT